MPLSRLQIITRVPFGNGQGFADSGPYERIDAIAHYTVDPANEVNRDIVDLDKAVRDDAGLVHFSGDVIFLVPVNPGSVCRTVLLEVPNRGNAAFIDSSAEFLIRRSCSVVSCGWQWDVPRTAGRMGLEAPIVPDGRVDADSKMQLRLQPNSDCADLPLTDQHVGEVGNHQPITPADLNDPDATLMVRDGMYATATTIARKHWRFARDKDGTPIVDANSVWLASGFEAGRIYDLIFRPKNCRVVGAGLLAIRDMAVYLKGDDLSNPLNGCIEHVIGVGSSQCGRFLRTYLHLGLNVDEANRQALDGVMITIAGGRRGEFNQRYGQPSVQPTPSFGHLFPFADSAQTNPSSGKIAGLLDRQRQRGGVPRIFYTDTSSDYWRGDAGLAHTDAGTGADVEPPAEVRRYLFASTAHSGGAVGLSDRSRFGTRGANYFNVIAWGPLARAALVNLLEWVRGTEPPPSVFPRWQDGTAASREAVIAKLERVTKLTLPDIAKLPCIVPLDLGAGVQAGVGSFPATVAGEPYSCIVADVDNNGNEIGGIRLPAIEVPIATHTGFNPRHPDTGGAGQLLEYIGSMEPFSISRIKNDYATRNDYLEATARIAAVLVDKRYLLKEDAELSVRNATDLYDAIMDSR